MSPAGPANRRQGRLVDLHRHNAGLAAAVGEAEKHCWTPRLLRRLHRRRQVGRGGDRLEVDRGDDDTLGQTLFGDNTFLTCLDSEIEIAAGNSYRAEFSFDMPILPHGHYSVVVSAAAGTQESHVQHHWIHDALLIKSEASSASTGLIGIPMTLIRLSKLESAES